MAENYNKICKQYKDDPKYVGKISCYPKAFLSQSMNDDGTLERGGTTIYSFLIFDSNGGQSSMKFEIMSDVRKYYEKVKEFLDNKNNVC